MSEVNLYFDWTRISFQPLRANPLGYLCRIAVAVFGSERISLVCPQCLPNACSGLQLVISSREAPFSVLNSVMSTRSLSGVTFQRRLDSPRYTQMQAGAGEWSISQDYNSMINVSATSIRSYAVVYIMQWRFSSNTLRTNLTASFR